MGLSKKTQQHREQRGLAAIDNEDYLLIPSECNSERNFF
jgi:hypothetical protein